MTTIKLDPGAALLLDALHGAGHAAYAVGGCVRDSLLGLDPHDWDLCTSARPEQVMALFGEEKCIPTGLQHGTVTVKQGGRLYETTTFRTEGAYSDGRHPDAVCFVPDVREDLARRDFTINAMAYSAEEGLIDPFGGRDDLAAHLVRAVGEPERRFEEDALRILRLYRFAARFGFAIDPATGAAARALGPHLDCVSAERIQEELLKLLAAPRPGSYLEPAVLAVVLPELEPEKQPERFAELCRTIDRIEPTAENVPARLAALLCPLGEAGARKALRKLKCSNALTDEVTALEREAGGGAGSFLLGHESGHSIARPIACGNRVPPQRTVLGETPSTPNTTLTVQAKRLLGRYELPTIQRLTALCSARHPEQAGVFAALRAEAERLTAENACCRVSQLAVNGRDLMAPRAGFTYSFSKASRLKINYGKAFRAPTIFELYSQMIHSPIASMRVIVEGDPDLQPEKSTNFDISLEGEKGKATGKLTYFHNKISNLIDAESVSRSFSGGTRTFLYKYRNVDKATFDGVEAETKYKFDKHWSARANYTYLDARDGNTNKRLTGRALNTGTVELSWTDAKKDPWTATLYNQWYQNYLTSANNKSYSYSLTNFVVTKDIGKMSLYAGIDNLFNKKFDSSDSIWTDGRVWRAGAEWKF